MHEVCDIRGPLCVDTHNWQLYVGVSTRAVYAAGERDMSSDGRGVSRPSLHPQSFEGLPNARLRAGEDAAALSPLSALAESARGWGPEAGLQPVELSWEALAAASSPRDVAALGPQWAAWAARARSRAELEGWHAAAHAAVRGTASGRAAPLPRLPPRVTWLAGRAPNASGAVFLANMQSIWIEHVYHFARSALGVWAARRLNASARGAGGGAWEGGPGNARSGGGRALPTMEALLLTGSYGGGAYTGTANLMPWVGALLRLIAPGARLLLTGNLRRDGDLALRGGGPGEADWLCFPRSVLASELDALFASAGDAAALRLAAHARLGLAGRPAAGGAHPPRRISLVQRERRGLWNASGLEALAAGTGLEWGWLTAAAAGPVEAQARAFAATGILIAPHGAGLTNMLFMTAGSVVIELFPPFYAPGMYRELAGLLGLRHIGLPGRAPPAELVASLPWSQRMATGWEALDGPLRQRAACEGPPAHPSHGDAPWGGACTAGTDLTILPDMRRLEDALDTALDAIGCRDALCAQAVGGPYVDMRKGAPGKRVDW